MLQIRLKDGPSDDAVVLTKKTILGSHPLVDVVIGDEENREIWPTHAVVSRAGKRLMLMALDAKAIVHLNGTPVEQAAVKEGDVIAIGGVELIVEPAPAATGDAVATLLTSAPDAPEETTETPGTAGTTQRSLPGEAWGSDSWELPFAGDESATTSAAPAEPPVEAETPSAQVPDHQVKLDMSDLPEIGWGHQSAPTADAPPPPKRTPTTRRVAKPAPAAAEDDLVRIEEPTEVRPAASAPSAPAPPRSNDALILPPGALPKRTAGKRKTKTIRGKRAASGRLQAVDNKGRLDVDASIRAHSKRVEVKDLARKTSTIRVLNYSTIKALIDDAVAEAMAFVGAKLEQQERQKLLQEAESEFKERLEAFQAEKAGLEAQALTLQNQLKRATSLLEDERAREVQSDQFTVSEAGMTDMEERFARVLSGAVKGGDLDPAFQKQIEEMIQHLLDDEREKIAEHAREAQSDSIKLLEKKIRRLAGSLEEAEAEATKQQRRAAAMEAMGGSVRGLEAGIGVDDDDPDAERKRELLKEIFEQNQAIREQLEGLGVQLSAPPDAEERYKAREAAAREREAEEARIAAEDAEPDAAETGIDAGDDAADLADTDDVPEPVAASAGGDDFFGEDPDDQVWQPGMSFSSEPADDGGGDVKKLTDYEEFEPPPLQRRE